MNPSGASYVRFGSLTEIRHLPGMPAFLQWHQLGLHSAEQARQLGDIRRDPPRLSSLDKI
jgi:hypothetical protein